MSRFNNSVGVYMICPYCDAQTTQILEEREIHRNGGKTIDREYHCDCIECGNDISPCADFVAQHNFKDQLRQWGLLGCA